MADNFLTEMASLVDADSAELAAFRIIPGTQGMRELTLFWEIDDEKRAESACRYLSLSTSTKNKTAHRQWVVDPIGSIEKYAGTYRQVSLALAKHNERPGVLQVLREGFLQALAEDETKEDEARLVSVVRGPITRLRTLTRVWMNIDPEFLQTIEATKASVTTVTNPQCEVLGAEDGEDPLLGQKKYMGVFIVTGREGKPVEDDTCAALYESLQEVVSPADTTALAALNGVIMQGNEILTAFAIETGEEDTLAYKYTNINPANRATMMAYADANLVSSLATGYTYVDRKFQEEENGTATFSVLFKKIATSAPADTTALAALPYIVTQGNKILAPFALPRAVADGTVGEEDTVAYIFKYLAPSSKATVMAFTDANLVSALPGAPWLFVDKKWDEDDKGYATFTVLFGKVAWGTFNASSPDLTWDDNDSTTHEERHELWFKVANTATLTNLYTATALYNVMSVRITERGDGALNIERTQLKEAVGTLGAEIEPVDNGKLNPFAIQSGDYAQFTIVNERMKLKTTAYAVPANSTDYTLVNTKEEKRPDGLWNKYYVYRKHTWRTWGADTYTPDHIESGNPTQEREEIIKTWLGIRKADLATALTALKLETGNTPVATGYHLTGVKVHDNQDGSLTFTRTEIKKFSNVANTDATLVGQEKIRPFALQSGTLDALTSEYDNFTLTEVEAISDAVPSGYTLVHKQNAPSGSFYKAIFLYHKTTWVAWDHDSGAADLTEYDNAGTDNEKEVITKTWFGIVKSSLATAIAAIRTGTTNFAPTAGYIITKASVRDNQDGSITLVQEQRKQVNNKDVGVAATPGYQAIRPFGWDGGSFNEIETHYEHFTASGLATAISGESAPATYTLVAREPTLQPDGLYNMVFRYRSVTFSNTSGTTPNLVLANLRTLGHVNPVDINGDSTTYGINGSIIKGADGIPIANAPEILNNQAVTSGFLFSRATIEDNKDGSASIRRQEDKTRAISGYVVVQFSASNGRHEERQIVEWYNLVESDADLIVADAATNKAAMASSSYTPPTGGIYAAGHKLDTVQKEPESNGQTFKVTRVTFIPRSFGGGAEPYILGTEAPFKMEGVEVKNGDALYGVYIVEIDRIVTASLSSAQDFADLSHYDPVTLKKLGIVEYVERHDVYVGYKVRYGNAGSTFAAWTAAQP